MNCMSKWWFFKGVYNEATCIGYSEYTELDISYNTTTGSYKELNIYTDNNTKEETNG